MFVLLKILNKEQFSAICYDTFLGLKLECYTYFSFTNHFDVISRT